MEHLFIKDENCIDEEQLLENINVEQEDTLLDFEEENDENEDNNSNSIHDKHQNKNRNTKSLNKNSKNKGKQKQVTFAIDNNQNKESDHYNNDLNKDSDIFNEDSDDSNEDSDDFNEDANNFNEDSDDFNEDSNNLNEDSDDLNEDSNNLNEDSDDFDENSEDFSDLNSNFDKNKNIKKQPKPKRVSNVDSSTLFQLKPPQINNITWEEINASWEGMFGYSNKLRLGVMKRDILACFRDLKVMRETNPFDNILLNIWEKKFNKWLDELDNVQNSETNEASTSSTSHKETISSHDYIRDDAKMNNKKYRDDMKILMEKKVKKKDIFKVGNIVNLKIPKADKGKLGRRNCLESTELTSMAELTNIPNKVVTVTEAVRLQSNVNSVKCKCPNTNCNTMKCACKKLNLSCNIRCHPGKTCHNPSL
ncbi:unnamed protein product [Rhizophagus irregularis]|nr:unnamed protein product [Rhizophagus irregularis]CAB4417977.1 unnamed protein product [Rhizophagus irregularis]